MKSISLLIKPSSEICNVNCSYCFYKELKTSGDVTSKGAMKDSTMKNLIKNVFADLNDGDMIEFAFQGGEPTLLGLEFYKKFVGHIKYINRPRVNVNYSFQTNGIIIDEEWCKFFKENNFLLGLSLDGPKDINDYYRKDFQARGTYEYIMNTKKLFDKYNIEYNILSVLTNKSAKEAEKLWEFIRENHIEYIQFIPCLDDIHNKHNSEYALVPENFAHFYKTIFPLWRDSLEDGKYYSISFIDQIINLLSGNPNISCALRGSCSPQYVIESDGSVYPCDFYVLEEFNSGNINTNTLRQIFDNPAMQGFLSNKRRISVYCRKCKFLSICHGGCRRLEKAVYLNDSQTYCGYQDFLESTIAEMISITEKLIKI